MPHSILLQDFVNHLIVEMSTFICDQCLWSVEPCKYVAVKELGYHTSVISACRYCFYPFRDVIYSRKMYKLLNEGGNGPMKSIPHKSNSSTSRIVLMGGSSFLEMLPILWHLSQVDTNW